MGLMRFAVSPPERVTKEVVQQAYLTGMDRVSWQIHPSVEGGELVLLRAVSDSANLHMPWPVEGRGWLTLLTGSLIEQPRPYQLPLELARGVVGQLRNQVADWQMLGLTVPEGVPAKVAEATKHLARAAASQDDPPASAALAEAALNSALEAADSLVAAYVEQSLAARRRPGGKLAAILAADLGSSPLDDATAGQVLSAFNAASVPVCWREIEASEGRFDWSVCDQQIEWCRAHGLKVLGGPLVLFDPRGLPDWLCLWEGDFDSILSFVSEFVQAAVTRYAGKVDAWQCAGRVNTADILGLREEERLRLGARAIELVRSLDPKAATLVSYEQPWAEYTSRKELDFPPLQFADALVRAGLELRGVVLEMNIGCFPGGTLPRTLLDVSRQLDYWSALGLPLLVSVTVPSGADYDPRAVRKAKLLPGGGTGRSQQAWIARYVPLILAKSYVQGVIWNQLRDSELHDFPHGGVFDAQLQPKPALRTLAAIRQKYLK